MGIPWSKEIVLDQAAFLGIFAGAPLGIFAGPQRAFLGIFATPQGVLLGIFVGPQVAFLGMFAAPQGALLEIFVGIVVPGPQSALVVLDASVFVFFVPGIAFTVVKGINALELAIRVLGAGVVLGACHSTTNWGRIHSLGTGQCQNQHKRQDSGKHCLSKASHRSTGTQKIDLSSQAPKPVGSGSIGSGHCSTAP
jgi:hypothetical protein